MYFILYADDKSAKLNDKFAKQSDKIEKVRNTAHKLKNGKFENIISFFLTFM